MSAADTNLAPLLQQTLDAALSYLTADDSVAATATLEELRSRLCLPLNTDPIDPEAVLSDLLRGVDGGITRSTGGRFFGWVIGGTLPAALSADWLTSTWDQNAGVYACSPAAAVIEEACGRWLKDLLHLPADASFALTTGCQAAHITALAAARHAVLARQGWNVARQGLAGAPAIRILTSTERHGTLLRAVRLLGMGEDQIITLPTDAEGRLSLSTLEASLQSAPEAPTIVVLQAGDLNIGAFDDFAALIPLAHAYHAWVHIDGAFGLWAAASPRLQHLIHGAELADSWATDGHKWLNVPYDCGYAFVANRSAHHASFALNSSYVEHSSNVREQIDWNIEWSRRGRGFSTWAALRSLGRTGVADLIERTCHFAKDLATRIGALPHAELLYPTIALNQAIVRYLDPKPDATEADHDAFTERIVAAIVASGEAYFTNTTWRGKRAMRISVSCHQTTPEDVDRTVAAVAKVLQQHTERSK